jgi:hypothetical protein
MHRWLLLNRLRMGHIRTAFLPQRRCIIRINLRVIASTGDRDIGHAAVEQVLRAQFSIYVNQDTVGSLSLAGVASHGITVVEMLRLGRVEFNGAPAVHLQAQPPVFVNALDGANSRFATLTSLVGAVNWMRSPTKNSASLRGRPKPLRSAWIVSSLRAVLKLDS